MAGLTARLQHAVGETYRIEEELGGGGMSRVFLAEEVRLGRNVVIKVLPPEMAAGVNVERFEREIQLAAKLQHPHISGRTPIRISSRWCVTWSSAWRGWWEKTGRDDRAPRHCVSDGRNVQSG